MSENESNKRENELNENRIKILQITISILVLLIAFIGLIVNTANAKFTIDTEFLEQIFVASNLTVLFIALIWINKSPTLKFKNGIKGKENYCRKFNIRTLKREKVGEAKTTTEGNKTIELSNDKSNKIDGYSISRAESNNKRVNKSVEQFCNNILGYIILLMGVYLGFLFDQEESSGHIFFVLWVTSLNLFSATFLYSAFSVLNDKTVELKSKQAVSNTYWKIPFIVSFLTILIFIFCLMDTIRNSVNSNNSRKINSLVITNASEISISNSNETSISNADKFSIQDIQTQTENLTIVSSEKIKTKNAEEVKIFGGEKKNENIYINIFRLVAGVWNGLAMILLFSRYISIKHSVDNIHKISGTNLESLIFLGIIFLLPVYALAQPLFGSFDIDSFGDAKVFSNWVFGICIIGKIFFLYITYLFIKNKSIHLYLHLVINRHGVPSEIREYFDLKFK